MKSPEKLETVKRVTYLGVWGTCLMLKPIASFCTVPPPGPCEQGFSMVQVWGLATCPCKLVVGFGGAHDEIKRARLFFLNEAFSAIYSLTGETRERSA